MWFDEYEFKVGDSVLGKINEGLLSADYGVVVFSRAFFTKYRTKTELDGLMALEAKNGKMVLPVWLDIRAAEIAELMPTLAGRYAVSADKGLDRVVAEIRAAIDGADRQRELSRGSSAKERIQKLSAERKARKAADSLLHSMKGVQLAGAEASKLMDAAQQSITAVSTDELPFKGAREGNQLEVQAPSRLRLRIHYEDGASSTAEDAQLVCLLYQLGRLGDFGQRESPRKREEVRFWPHFTESETVVWSVSKERESALSTDVVIDQLVNTLVGLVEAENR